MNGSGRRKCQSWIESFVKYTDNLESAPIFRRWAAITTIAAVLEQKVFVTTSSPLYPNLYVFLVGDAGIGKTRPIMAARGFIDEMPEPHLGHTSMTMAALVDMLAENKRTIINMPDPAVEYNSLVIVADELSAFMDQYDSGLIAGLTTFYDVVPYSQGRRTRDIKIKIARPQLNILSGSTPSNLIKFVPEFAWEQGFTSRVILIYSDERPLIDVFHTPSIIKPPDMIYDLKTINSLIGQFGWDEPFAKAMHDWKLMGYPNVPRHPKLTHYCSRRFAHLLKLSMIASVDRGNDLMLTVIDFNKAMGWLLEAEAMMPLIFQTGQGGIDREAIDEILHFVQTKGSVGEASLIRFAKNYVPLYNVARVIEVMEKSGMITAKSLDKQGYKIFTG